MLVLLAIGFLSLFDRYEGFDLNIPATHEKEISTLPDLNLPCSESSNAHQKVRMPSVSVDATMTVASIPRDLAKRPGSLHTNRILSTSESGLSERQPSKKYQKEWSMDVPASTKSKDLLSAMSSHLYDPPATSSTEPLKLPLLLQQETPTRLNFPVEAWPALQRFFFIYEINIYLGQEAPHIFETRDRKLLERDYKALPNMLKHVFSILYKIAQYKSDRRKYRRRMREDKRSLGDLGKQIEIDVTTPPSKRQKSHFEEPSEITRVYQHYQGSGSYLSDLHAKFPDIPLDYQKPTSPENIEETTSLQSPINPDVPRAHGDPQDTKETIRYFIEYLCDDLLVFRRTLHYVKVEPTASWKGISEIQQVLGKTPRTAKGFTPNNIALRDSWIWFYARQLGKEEIQNLPQKERETIQCLIQRLNNWTANSQVGGLAQAIKQKKPKRGKNSAEENVKVFNPFMGWGDDTCAIFVYITRLLKKYFESYSSLSNATPGVYQDSLTMMITYLTNISELPRAPKFHQFEQCFEVKKSASKILLKEIFDRLSTTVDRIRTLSFVFCLFEIWVYESGHPLLAACQASRLPGKSVRVSTNLKTLLCQAVIFDVTRRFLFGR